MTAPDPSHIMQIASGYGVSRALMSAVSLGLYTRLTGGPMTLDEIAEEYGFLRRPVMDFLDFLVSVTSRERSSFPGARTQASAVSRRLLEGPASAAIAFK